jgi:hypothetical protein
MLTSKMKAIIKPDNYGLIVIDQVFGVYRPRTEQNIVMQGDLVRDQSGKVHRFEYRENDTIFVSPV